MSVLADFTWHDGERVVRFGPGALADAPALIDAPYSLLCTERSAGMAPALAAAAHDRHDVPAGLVDRVAAGLRGAPGRATLVALGGGRVIDVAKALAAADPPRRVVAVPTTLSGAEMTAIHRHAEGIPSDAPRVRPALVVNDPALSASQPRPAMVASAMNALGHVVEAPLTTRANPVATMAADRALDLIRGGLSGADPDRPALALGALLAGYAIGSSGYGLHHVLAQTLVRFAGLGHGPANAVMLPFSIAALADRFPARAEALGMALTVAAAGADAAGATRLRDLGVGEDDLAGLARHAAERAELALTPPAASAAEIEGIYRAAL